MNKKGLKQQYKIIINMKNVPNILPYNTDLESGGIPDVPLALLLLLREPGPDDDLLALPLLHLLVHGALGRQSMLKGSVSREISSCFFKTYRPE
jgi:hypothetical protein